MSTPEAVPEVILLPRDRREAPERYPVIGFGLLAAFVLVSYGAELRHGGVGVALKRVAGHGSQLASSVGGSSSPLSMDAALVQSAKVLRGVDCLASAKLPLEPACRTEASTSIQHFMGMVKTDLTLRGPQPSTKARSLRPVAIQLNLMMVSILPKVLSTSHMDRSADLSLNTFATSAKKYIDQVDTAFDINNPKWKSTDVAADDMPTGDQAAPAEPVAPAEQPAAEAAKAEEPTDAAVAGKKAGDEAEDIVHDPALIAALVKGIDDAHKMFASAGHDSEQLQEAIQQTKPMLEDVDTKLQRYRAVPHGDDAAQQKASAFVSRVDQARGHILRAIIDFQHATTAATSQEQEGPFRAADDLLEKAGDDVSAAQALAKTAP